MKEPIIAPPPGFVFSGGLFVPEKAAKTVFEKRVVGFAPEAPAVEDKRKPQTGDYRRRRMVAF